MSTGTMTSKGQITIPKDVRIALGLSPGVVVSFVQNGEGEYVISRAGTSASDLAGALKYSGQPKTLDEMETAIAEGATGR
ncbi:AbrB/MazE/SpoVT family DNA-binding domain-containing protein [Marihabitans asiaticum]|uniref:AbrB family looped-hinge helix DNA binding protein n=1 Tax=Marihabitans asiaticum TaxID=415218 RepID=A0A560W6K1_9MICO|nr:AbrB/MazE/SpoVT family DNA-binding domain-containing protein [Marihabitans asiaticum]TWD13243.1 AbrB family looped-hinge helix DNA binding protein [Marihabitans asiaticum]